MVIECQGVNGPQNKYDLNTLVKLGLIIILAAAIE